MSTTKKGIDNMKLVFNAVTKFVLGFLIVGLLVFLPAGTIEYKHGWLFILLLFVDSLRYIVFCNPIVNYV